MGLIPVCLIYSAFPWLSFHFVEIFFFFDGFTQGAKTAKGTQDQSPKE
jgi:hypothetical protein